MNVINISENALFELVDKVITYVRQQTPEREQRFISKEETMKRLGIKSATTLQKLRDTGAISFSYVTKRNILYDASSIDAYLNQKSVTAF